ncbi:uncharacterized protein J3R85_008210 [Psidium guajava]|nr:uncharacterized protein J3R85_008210 [Psidium guajava]
MVGNLAYPIRVLVRSPHCDHTIHRRNLPVLIVSLALPDSCQFGVDMPVSIQVCSHYSLSLIVLF